MSARAIIISKVLLLYSQTQLYRLTIYRLRFMITGKGAKNMDTPVSITKLHELRAQKGVLIATHRGVMGGNIIENTIGGYRAAVNMGSDIVEMDVPRTLDGKLVCIHDGMERRLFMANWIPTPMLLERFALRRRYMNQSLSRLSQTPCRFEDALQALKGRCIINVDRCWGHWQKVCEVVARFGMEDQVLFKCVPCEKYLKVLESQQTRFLYMPIIKKMQDFETVERFNLTVPAYEFVFSTPTSSIIAPEILSKLKQKGILLWGNAIDIHEGGDLCAGFDDYISLTDDPEKGWGKLIEMGFDILQTDFPSALHNYLVKKGVRRA